MSKIVTSKHKLCRRTGKNFWGDATSPVLTKNKVPGPDRKNKGRVSNYGLNLMEIRMIRMFYGALTRDYLKKIYAESKKMHKGRLDENIMKILESRLSTFVYRAKWAQTIFGAKQLVSHGKVLVNGKKVDINSYRLKVGDRVQLQETVHDNAHVKNAVSSGSRKVPEYINLEGEFNGIYMTPNITTINYPVKFDYQRLISFFSR
jgi:small subunit ribosomal protein S4